MQREWPRPGGGRCRGGVSGHVPVFSVVVDPNTISTDPDIQALMSTPLGGPGRVRLVTHVAFFGSALNGQSVQSDDFAFPVDVCSGCLIAFHDEPRFAVPNCAGVAPDAASTMQAPCLFGEDLPVDCAACGQLPSCLGAPPAGDGGAG